MGHPVRRLGADAGSQLYDTSNRAAIAFDQLKEDEKQSVLAVLGTIEREGVDASGLDVTKRGGPPPLYFLRAAPDVIVILRAEPGQPIEARDIVQPATLESFAHRFAHTG